MAYTVTWKPNLGPSIVFNAANLKYPIDGAVRFETPFSDVEVKKMQQSSEHPTFGYPQHCKAILEGHILGIDGADFVANRRAFLRALTPPVGVLESRRHGTLTIDDDDEPEAMYAFCRVISRTADYDAVGSPERCPFFVTWKSFEVNFIGVGSGTEYPMG